jgi:hypothetical protein
MSVHYALDHIIPRWSQIVGLKEMEILKLDLAWSKNWRREAFRVAFADSARQGEEAILLAGDNGTAILLWLLDTSTSFTLSSQNLAV